MIRFRLLGPIELRAADGTEIRSIISQPKRLALLAYLAVNPGAFHRRDTLLALFWPELDQQRGRGALRQAVYHLRRALGADVLIARGDDELGIDLDHLWCDVAAFRLALQEKRCADAAELHRGDLLTGVHVDQALELERWIDEERARLRSAAAKAAWSVADDEEAAGDLSAAASWARRAVELEPDDEEAARRLISLLDRTGDRAGALRVYQDLARRLEREYEAEPSPATQALIEQVRVAEPEHGKADYTDRQSERGRAERAAIAEGGSAGMASGVRRRSVEGDSAIIAVLPFTCRGKPEFDYLREGMADLLGLAIDGTDSLYCIEPRLLLTWLARREEGGKGKELQDSELCRAVGNRFGADLCVIGGIVQAGDRLRAHAVLYDVASPEEPRLRVTAEASVDEVFTLADRLATQLLIQGVGTPVRDLARIAALTTGSLPALKSYLNGERAFRAGRYTPAVEAFQAAVNQDPHFALAHYRMAVLAEWAGLIPLARESAARALRDAERLPVNIRRLLEALHAYFEGDISTAETRYREILAIYPDSAEAWAHLAKLGYFLGSLRGKRFAEVKQPLEQARALDPDNVITLVHLANVAAKEGRDDEVDRLIGQVLELQRPGDYTDYPIILRILRAFELADRDEEERLWGELETSNEFTLFWSFIVLTLLVGDLAAAGRVAALMVRASRPQPVQLFGRLMLAALELAHGRWSGAQMELDAAALLDAPTAAVHRALLALVSFREPDHDELTRLRDELLGVQSQRVESEQVMEPWFTAHSEVLGTARLYLLGILHARLGELEEAESCAAELDQVVGGFARVAAARDAACGIRAALALIRGDNANTALGWLERCQLAAPMYAYIPSPLYGRLHERYLRAELLARKGRTVEAETWLAVLGEDSPHGFIYLAASHLRRAELLESRGESDLARAHYSHFVHLWKGCDPELQPLVAKALARLEELPDRTTGRQAELLTAASTSPSAAPESSLKEAGGPESRHLWSANRNTIALAIILMVAVVMAAIFVQRPERPPPPRIMVGAIEDITGSDDGELALALASMLATNLARVSGVEVISEIRVHELLTQLGAFGAGAEEQGSRTASNAVLLRAASAAGATQILRGSLHSRANGAYRLELQRVDLGSGTVRAAYTVQGRDLFVLADAAAASLAAEFGFVPPAPGFAEVTTGSLIAYRFYQEGLGEYYAGDHNRARHLFNAAVEEDSAFAMAMYYLARTTSFPRSAELLLEAVQLAQRVSDRERLLIEAAWTAATDDPRRLAIAETLAVRYPAEPSGHLFLGQAKLWSGDFLGALPYLRRVVEMDSIGLHQATTGCRACDALWDITSAYSLADSLSAAQRVARDWIRLQPGSAAPWIALAFALDGEGLYDEAFAAVDSAMSLQPGAQIVAVRGAIHIRSADFDGHERMARELLRSGGADAKESALWSLALAQRTQGRPREALETTRKLYSLAARPSASPADLAFPRLAEAQALFEAGHLREAAASFESIAEVEIVNQAAARNARHRAWLLTLAAAPYAELQDTTRLRTLADSVQRLGSLSAYARDQRLHHHIRGLLLRIQGRDAEAAAEFRKSLFSPVGGYTRTNLELARSLIATDRLDEAITILEEALRGPVGAAGYYLTRTEIHELLAQALATAGRNDEAVPHLRWVVAAWGEGEPEFAQRAERAQQKIGAGANRIRQHGLPENRYLSVVRAGGEAQ